LRGVGIPSKYLVGISRNSENSGHCLVESYVRNRWILIDPSYFQLNLIPSKSSFYNNYHVVKEGLDSWGCEIKTYEDWKKVSNTLNEKVRNVLKKN